MLIPLIALLAASPPAPPKRVYVGAYLTDVSDFDLKGGRFKADLRVWLKWLGDDAVPVLSFENAEIDSKDELGRESDGRWHSVQWRVQGTFRGDFPVYSFPFDRQTLPVVFGMDESFGTLVPDLGASGMSSHFSITGWRYEPYFNARVEERRFGSDLGSVAHEGENAVLRRVAFTVEMQRPFGPYLLKFALPLALILLMALLALLVPPTELEVRSAMGVTALLSCIAFHYTQADTLPDVTYLVAADKVFLGAYVFVTCTLLISVIAFRSHEKRPALARRADNVGVWGLPSAALVSLVVLVTGALKSEPASAAAPLAARPDLKLLKVGVASLETVQGSGLPSRRGNLVVRGADGLWYAQLAEEAPAMTNAGVRLLPDGGMRVRWKLRPGATWHDGKPVTLEDLLFSIDTVTNPLRSSVEPVDERTVDVTYSERRNEWLNGFSLFSRQALHPAWADGGRDALAKAASEPKAPTAGPYVLDTFAKGDRAVLVRNAAFAGARPVFERIEVLQAADADALLTGKVDVLPVLTGAQFEALRGQPNVRILEQPGDVLWVLVPKLDTPPWNDPEARRALLQAIDREGLSRALEPAPARVAWGWRAGTHGDVPRARKLKELGFAGQKLQLHVAALKVKTSANALLCERIAADLSAAGLVVEVVEHAELNPLLQKRDFEGLVLASRDTTEAARFMNVAQEGGRYVLDRPDGSHFDAPMVDAYARMVTSLYDERRTLLEQKLQGLWLQRLPMIPLVLTSRLAAVRSDLEGPEWGQADSLWWNLADWRFKQN